MVIDYSLGLLWRAEFPNLLNDRTLAFSRFLSLEKIFNNNPEFHIKYHKTIKVYIWKGHAIKIENENNTNVIITYPIIDVGATWNSTLLNTSLLKWPDLLNNLFGVLTRFPNGRYVVMGDIEQTFHRMFVENISSQRLWCITYFMER